MHNYKTPIKPTQQSITLHNTQLLKVETTQKLKCVPVSVSQITMAHHPFCLLTTLTLAFQLTVFFSHFASARTPTNAAPQPQDLVRSSCEHASYPNICIHTLSSYTRPAKTPKDLAQAAVKVSLSQAKRVSNYLIVHKLIKTHLAIKTCQFILIVQIFNSITIYVTNKLIKVSVQCKEHLSHLLKHVLLPKI